MLFEMADGSRGARDRPPRRALFSSAVTRRLTLVTALVVAIAFALGIVGLTVTSAQQQSLRAHGAEATATITDAPPLSHGSGRIVVAFTGGEGTPHTASIEVNTQLAVGTPVQVHYDTTHPETAELSGALAADGVGSQRGLYITALVLLGACLLGLGAALVRGSRRGRRDEFLPPPTSTRPDP